jgi:8-oxo-dGTP diphosphatase
LGARAIFLDRETAEAARGRLLRAGFAAELRRDPLAGEDDDEDHPWAVLSDAPEVMVELLAEEYDGWLDVDRDPAERPPPLDLPVAPRRRKHGDGPAEP